MDFSLLNKDFIVILQRNFNDIVMLERKFTSFLESFLLEEPNKILLVNGARQIGKSYLIRYVGQKLFRHFVEINLKEDIEGDKVFADVHTTNVPPPWATKPIRWFFWMRYKAILT